MKQLVPLTKTLIKIDRNGTKYYHVDACPKCGGTGYYDATTIDGNRCWKCQNSGYFPHTVKEYTREYLDKQAKKAHEKILAKNLADLPRNIKRNTPFWTVENPIYAVKGDTYAIRDELRRKGALWAQELRTWVFHKPTEEYETVEIHFDDIFYINEYNMPIRKDEEFWAIVDSLK